MFCVVYSVEDSEDPGGGCLQKSLILLHSLQSNCKINNSTPADYTAVDWLHVHDVADAETDVFLNFFVSSHITTNTGCSS